MNKLFLILFASVAMIACGNKEAKHNHSKNEEKMKTVELTKAEFLTKVANYETNPQMSMGAMGKAELKNAIDRILLKK